MSLHRSNTSSKLPAPAQKAPSVADKNSERRYVPAHATQMSAINAQNENNSIADICAQPFVSLAAIGEPEVGKTTVLLRFVQRNFQERRIATAGFDRIPMWMMSRHPYYDRVTNVTLYDTAGQERYRSFGPGLLRDVEAVMIIFDASRPATFEECKRWRVLLDSVNSWCLVMLIASKMDVYRERDEKTNQFKCKQWLATPDMAPDERKAIMDAGGIDLLAAAKSSDLRCTAGAYAVSSLDGSGVDAAFVDLVDQAVDYQQALAAAHAKNARTGSGSTEVAQFGSRRQSERGVNLRAAAPEVQVTNKISCCAVK